MTTVGALDARLLAPAAHPFVGTGWRVSRPARLPTVEPTRVHIGAASEERPEERGIRGGLGGCRSKGDAQSQAP